METCENCKMNRLCKDLDALGYTRGCNTLHPIRKTNADKIRQMTDEELAELLEGEYGNMLPNTALSWLKQEVEDD